MLKELVTISPRKLETIVVTSWFILNVFGGIISTILLLLIYFFTPLWWLPILYLIWMFIDRNTHTNGGRPIEAVKNSIIWRHYNNYFPVVHTKSENCQVKPNRNYIFACYPHGVYPYAAVGALSTNQNRFKELYPIHKRNFVTLNMMFRLPIVRECILALGGIGASKESILHLLNKKEGGNIVMITPGGAKEVFYCNPNEYSVVLKNRKGLVKLALQTGSPLVPVYTFGENYLFDVVPSSFLRNIQNFVKRTFGFAAIVTTSSIPKRHPLAIIVGDPIEVAKIDNPSKEEVDALHALFIEKLVYLFDQYKIHHIKNYEDVHLNIV